MNRFLLKGLASVCGGQICFLREDDKRGDRGRLYLMQEEIYRELYVAVRELPEKCQKVFGLHLEGKKNDEIAEILGISVLTVKSHKQNAIHILKEKMGNLFLLYAYICEM